MFQNDFNPLIRNQPHQSDSNINAAGNPGAEVGRANSYEIKDGRYFAFYIFPYGLGKYKIRPVILNNTVL